MTTVLDECRRLRGLTWAALEREALAAGLTTTRIREVATLDEMRLAILKAKYPAIDTAGARG